MAWLKGVLARRPARIASVAQVNKTGRSVWALLARCGRYRVRRHRPWLDGVTVSLTANAAPGRL